MPAPPTGSRYLRLMPTALDELPQDRNSGDAGPAQRGVDHAAGGGRRPPSGAGQPPWDGPEGAEDHRRSARRTRTGTDVGQRALRLRRWASGSGTPDWRRCRPRHLWRLTIRSESAAPADDRPRRGVWPDLIPEGSTGARRALISQRLRDGRQPEFAGESARRRSLSPPRRPGWRDPRRGPRGPPRQPACRSSRRWRRAARPTPAGRRHSLRLARCRCSEQTATVTSPHAMPASSAASR